MGIGISATTIALLVGFPTSLALARTRLAAGNFLRAFILSPIVIPKIVLGVGWFIFFARISLIGGWIPLILAHTVIVLPFVVAILTANLSGLDPTIEEAAQDLGAGFVKVLWYVILPQIKSGVIISALLAFIVSFDQVESSIFLVRGENNTLPIEMFLYMEKWQDPTIAALSTLLIGFAAVITCATVAISRGIDLSNLLPTLGGKKSTR
ncbi:MAG: ABC transporter permease subunit [Armatimonadota bacterium]|nr:ABC transporter permease subunit [Armatimonadota bacterium]